MTRWESDQLVVLRERESRLQGTKETLTGHEGPETSANLNVGDSEQGSQPCCGSEYSRRARCGKTARRDLCGGCRVTGSPTALNLFCTPTAEIRSSFQEVREALLGVSGLGCFNSHFGEGHAQ